MNGLLTLNGTGALNATLLHRLQLYSLESFFRKIDAEIVNAIELGEFSAGVTTRNFPDAVVTKAKEELTFAGYTVTDLEEFGFIKIEWDMKE